MLAETCNKLISTHSSGGVIKIKENKKTYWLKISGEDKNNIIRKVSALLAKSNKFSFFETKAVLNSSERFEHEKCVLHYLGEMNIRVPEIKYEGPGFFVTSDEGNPLNIINPERINQQTLNELFEMFASLHANKVAHGRPALRDIVINDQNQLSILDFEESILNATEQQIARDIFMLLMDLCRIDSINEEQKTQALLLWKQRVPETVWQELIRISDLLKHFTFLAHAVLFFKKRNKLSKQIITTVKLIQKLK
jgi:tRNA A-37 threonylcarbamoyl transferase component Bud32